MKIRWTNPALRDVISIQEYIAKENPRAAYEVATRIKKLTSQLAQFPEIGREGRVPNTRELIITKTPFIAAYEFDENEVFILAVFHSSRKWPEQL